MLRSEYNTPTDEEHAHLMPRGGRGVGGELILYYIIYIYIYIYICIYIYIYIYIYVSYEYITPATPIVFLCVLVSLSRSFMSVHVTGYLIHSVHGHGLAQA